MPSALPHPSSCSGSIPAIPTPFPPDNGAGTAFPLGKGVYFASWGVLSLEYPCASLFFTLLWFGRGIRRTIHGWGFPGSVHSRLHPKSEIRVKIPPETFQKPQIPPQLSCASPRNHSHLHPNPRPDHKGWKRETKEPESLESNLWEQPAVLGRGQLSLAAVTGVSAFRRGQPKIPRPDPSCWNGRE